MIEFVESGGIFTLDRIQEFHPEDTVFPLVHISRFPDGGMYLHDGHHRGVSIWLGGRDFLRPEEYTIRDWDSYDAYAYPNLSAKWYTPVSLDTEVRLPDTKNLKRFITEAIERKADPDEIIETIQTLRHMYATARKHSNVIEMAEEVARLGKLKQRTM